MSQAELARRMGVSTQAVQHWESDGPDQTTPRRAKRAKLAKVLCVTEDWLEFGSGKMAGESTGAYTTTQPGTRPSDDAIEVALAFDRLSSAEQEFYRAAIFRDAAVGALLPWFKGVRQVPNSYDRYEKTVERQISQKLKANK